MDEAGYSIAETATIKAEVTYYEKVRNEIKLASGDYIDLKMYEPAMRHLIDSYIQADASERISAFDNFSLVQLLVDRGPDAVGDLPEDIRKDPEAVAETVEGNVRKVVIDKHPINPKYFDKMSELLEALIQQRRRAAISYTEYLAAITDLARQVANPEGSNHYPAGISTAALRALYDNLEKDEARAMAVHEAIQQSRQDDWRANAFKIKKVRLAIQDVLRDDDEQVDAILELAKNQDEY
jgi:type I restriction enzyme R subunit